MTGHENMVTVSHVLPLVPRASTCLKRGFRSVRNSDIFLLLRNCMKIYEDSYCMT